MDAKLEQFLREDRERVEQGRVLVEKVAVRNWTIELYKSGRATLRPSYRDRPNYIFHAEWDKKRQAAILDLYDSEYLPVYLLRAVQRIFKRNLDNIEQLEVKYGS